MIHHFLGVHPLVWGRTHFVRPAKAKPSGAAEEILMCALSKHEK